jgi:hypothetical protein
MALRAAPTRFVEHVETTGGEDVGEAGGLQPETPRDRSLGEEPERSQQSDVAPMAELRGRLTDDDRDERRFAGAVAPDQADLLARTHDERGVGHQHPIANFNGE